MLGLTPRQMIIAVIMLVTVPVLLYALIGALLGRSKGESAEKTADRAGDRIQKATGGMMSISRVFALTLVGIAVQFMGELATLGGAIWSDFIAQSPTIVASIVITALGYFGISGQLAVGATTFAIVALVIFGLGVTIENA